MKVEKIMTNVFDTVISKENLDVPNLLCLTKMIENGYAQCKIKHIPERSTFIVYGGKYHWHFYY